MNIAFFDFDGTITSYDNYTDFMIYSSGIIRKLIIAPFLLVLYVFYRTGFLSPAKTRTAVSFLSYSFRRENVIREAGARYAVSGVKILPSAAEQIARHRSRGDRIVIVSASLNVYLEPWAEIIGADLICTRLESKNGLMTGLYVSGDCSGKRKAASIAERYVLKNYGKIYVYGDTREDREMMELGNIVYYRWKRIRKKDISLIAGDKQN